MKYSVPKGVFDILPKQISPEEKWKESFYWQFVEEIMRKISENYGFSEIRTPIFEKTDLFTRGIGETSDIISKEMYTFDDKAGRSMSLRPEGTASVIRAFIENSLQQLGTLQKFFYIGPFFRYDRPQAGRYRQLHQYGVEAIGNPDPEQDLEIIDLQMELYRRLGLKNLNLMINSLGNIESRNAYKEKLLAYLKPFFNQLTPESQTRFIKNPLRILDSKDPKEQSLLKEAPTILDCLDKESETHFNELRLLLEKQNIPFVINPLLVRGLDYYNRTVFEVTSDVLGAQNTIGGGGRYDGLMSILGGPELPAIGFSTGIERIIQTMIGQNCHSPSPAHPFVVFIPLGVTAKDRCIPLLFSLRHKEISTEMLLSKKIQKALQTASELNSTYAVIIGEEEINRGVAQVKEMETRATKEIPLDSLEEYLINLFKQLDCHV